MRDNAPGRPKNSTSEPPCSKKSHWAPLISARSPTAPTAAPSPTITARATGPAVSDLWMWWRSCSRARCSSPPDGSIWFGYLKKMRPSIGAFNLGQDRLESLPFATRLRTHDSVIAADSRHVPHKVQCMLTGHVPPYLFCSHVIAALPHPVTVDSAVIAARCRTFSRCIGLNIRIS